MCDEIGVFGEDNAACPWTCLQIFSDLVLRLVHVDGENHQPLARKVTVDIIHEWLIATAVRTPGRPDCSRTTFPLRESLVKVSPASTWAVNCGVGSRPSALPRTLTPKRKVATILHEKNTVSTPLMLSSLSPRTVRNPVWIGVRARPSLPEALDAFQMLLCGRHRPLREKRSAKMSFRGLPEAYAKRATLLGDYHTRIRLTCQWPRAHQLPNLRTASNPASGRFYAWRGGGGWIFVEKSLHQVAGLRAQSVGDFQVEQ